MSVFAKPYLLKRRLLQFLSECWDVVQQSTRNGGITQQISIAKNSEIGVEGGWQITSLFIVLDRNSEKSAEGAKVEGRYTGDGRYSATTTEYLGCALNRICSNFRPTTYPKAPEETDVVVLKGNPKDNPDWRKWGSIQEHSSDSCFISIFR